ncbi:hypothetical protein [Rhodanobacter lindaniclasticus]
MTRVRLDVGSRTLVATLNVVVDDRLGLDEVALSETAWTLLDPMPDVLARVRHAEPAASAGALRAKVFGARLDDAQYLALVQDVMEAGCRTWSLPPSSRPARATASTTSRRPR